MKNTSIRIGIICGIISFLPALYGCFFNVPWMINGNFDQICLFMLGLLPMIGGLAAALEKKKSSGGILSFSEAMKSFLTVISISIGIYTLFYCLIFITNTHFTKEFEDLQNNALLVKLQHHEITQAEIDQRTKDLKNQSFASAVCAVAIITNVLFIVSELIISLIIASIIRKEK